MSGKKKGYLIGTAIAVGMMIVIEFAMWTKGYSFSWTSIPLFILFLLMCNMLTVPMYLQDEKAKVQEKLNEKEGVYQVKYRLECTYYVNAKNKDEALNNLRPFVELEDDEVEILYLGAKNMNV